MLEQLDPRYCPSATLSGNALTIVGSSSSDGATIFYDSSVDKLIVFDGSPSSKQFDPHQIETLRIFAGAGDDDIRISLLNSSASNTQTLRAVTIYGGEGNDKILLDAGRFDVRVFCGDGDDFLRCTNRHQGNDKVDGGNGSDTLVTNHGNDLVLGGAGDDRIDAGDGVDTIFGGDGSDEINLFHFGNDRRTGTEYADGGAGNDTIGGSNRPDIISGGPGRDRIYGRSGDDSIDGGSGNDTIYGEDGTDSLHGGRGSDLFRSTEARATEIDDLDAIMDRVD